MLKMNSPTKGRLMPTVAVSANGAAGHEKLDAHPTRARRATSSNSPTNDALMPSHWMSANGAAGQLSDDAQRTVARRATIQSERLTQ
jgi:hypothetical protein